MLISNHIITIDQGYIIRRYISISDYMPLEKFSFFKKCEKSFTPEVATGNI